MSDLPADNNVAEVARDYELSDGTNLLEASKQTPLTLVFLRHFGCTFTRQILRGLENLKQEATQRGSRLVLVHMLRDGKEAKYLGDEPAVASVSDPKCELYRAFGLGNGGLLELFGPRNWWLGIRALFQGCGVGRLAGNGLQMPGAFVLHQGEILAAQRARTAGDLPDLPRLFEDVSLPASS
ncbi:MAG: hypothetical protein R3242_03380 [Akkermansiaceae bacterium]|nr:hypothetical protein [Akkermansiaceae bacterium]